MNAKLAATITALLCGSGCLDPSKGEDPSAGLTDGYGLGLALPKEVPSAGPHREGNGMVSAVVADVARVGNAQLEGCNGDELEGRFGELLNQGFPFRALDLPFEACKRSAFDASAEHAETAIRKGTEVSTFQRLADHAQTAFQAGISALSEANPGSTAEAELWTYLASEAAFGNASITVASRSLEAYNSTKRRIDLENSYLNLLTTTLAQRTLVNLTRQLNWTGPCRAPDAESTYSATSKMLDEAISEARKFAKQDDEDQVHSDLGRLLNADAPNIGFYNANGWTLGLLGSQMVLQWEIRRIENSTTSPLPTREEAAFLLARFRQDERSLRFDDLLYPLLQDIEDEQTPWSREPARAALSLAPDPWPFDQLACD